MMQHQDKRQSQVPQLLGGKETSTAVYALVNEEHSDAANTANEALQTASNLQSWSVVILCYNEEANIEKTTQGALDILNKMRIKDYEVILVDDGSTDGSKSIIERMAAKNPKIKTVFHGVNKGIGPALLSGYKAAIMDNVGAIPGDGQFRIIDLLTNENIDSKEVLSFYREKNTQYSLFRKLLSATNKALNRFLLGLEVKDVNWVKFYKRDLLHALNLKLNSSLVSTEICARMAKEGVTFKQLPTVYLDREGGVAHGASFKTISKAFNELLILIRALKN